MDQRDETPIEAALELCVYAPLGFALEARSLLPRFVERGRNQVAMARVVGKFAVEKGRRDVEGRVAEGQATVVGLLRLTGVLGEDDTGSDGPDPTGRDPLTDRTGDAGPRRGAGRPSPDGRTTAPSTRRAAAAPAGPPPPDVDTLAIPGYESLSASQVVPRLDSLTAPELEDVRRYEQANRGRKTILNKIVQLQA